MGQYKRKLKKGERYFYSGQYLGIKYFSRAIYLTKSEAKKAERERISEIDEEQRRPKQSMSIFDLMEKRLDHIKLSKSNFYYVENRRYFKKALDLWGRVKLADQISKKDITELLNIEAKRLKAEKKSNHKLNAMIRSLKALFNYGIKYYDLDIKNPVVGFDMYSININLKYIPSEKDILAVKELCTNRQKFLIDFIDQTGCRIMEAVRFNYDDINNNQITLWTRKAKNSNYTPRTIPKPECLKNIDIMADKKVFEDWETYPRFLEEKIKSLGQKKWGFHNLRHRRASIWANSGMSTIEIMARLGHSNISTTMKYLQLLGFTRF